MIRRPPRSTLFPYTDALPIFGDTPIVEKMPPVQRDEEIYAGLHRDEHNRHIRLVGDEPELSLHVLWFRVAHDAQDRKSTRLNSSHSQISYAVFCLKKKSSNCPLGACCDPSNIRCSRRWASPVRPGRSSREPTRYIRCTATIGAARSSWCTTRSPLASVCVRTGKRSAVVGAVSVTSFSVDVGRAAARLRTRKRRARGAANLTPAPGRRPRPATC